jgi:Transcription factor WhiB
VGYPPRGAIHEWRELIQARPATEQDAARCVSKRGAALFFAERCDNKARATAREICSDRSVRQQCLGYALPNGV